MSTEATRDSPQVALLALLAPLLLVATLGSCANGKAPREDWAQELRLEAVEPLVVLPETTLVVRGEGFVSEVLGTTRLRLVGTFSSQGGTQEVDAPLLVEVVSAEELRVPLPTDVYSRVCPEATGDFVGTATVEVASLASGKIHESPALGMGLRCRPSLEPALVGVEDGSYHLNAEISVLADDLLLGDEEGTTVLVASGCFLRDAAFPPCDQNGTTFTDVEVPLTVSDTNNRRDAVLVLSPSLVGVHPGALDATVRLVSTHADSTQESSSEQAISITVLPLVLQEVETEGASLCGYVDLRGAGFVGGGPGETTEVDLVGTFSPDGGGADVPLDLTLVASFHSGELARYVLDEQDSLGQLIDLRQLSGTVVGTFTPRIVQGAESYTGAPLSGSFRIEPVHQEVYVNFTQGFKDALELFGLRAASEQIRARILQKARWIYRGLGVSFTEDVPLDFVWYAQVDMTGIDPNGLGLMGYDNSPGKDVGNLRLYDRIGGVNALTQQDGYPGYGGVFVESFLAFSAHPPSSVSALPTSSPVFDDIFDPFRPDMGKPVAADELAGLSQLESGETCPAGSRGERIRCAIFVLGNLLGTTMAHELGHSLGLADPGGELFHNSGDAPNRLMDSGAKRPFLERAELGGGGPEVFCTQSFEYLRAILPTTEPDPVDNRPSCY